MPPRGWRRSRSHPGIENPRVRSKSSRVVPPIDRAIFAASCSSQATGVVSQLFTSRGLPVGLPNRLASARIKPAGLPAVVAATVTLDDHPDQLVSLDHAIHGNLAGRAEQTPAWGLRVGNGVADQVGEDVSGSGDAAVGDLLDEVGWVNGLHRIDTAKEVLRGQLVGAALRRFPVVEVRPVGVGDSLQDEDSSRWSC